MHSDTDYAREGLDSEQVREDLERAIREHDRRIEDVYKPAEAYYEGDAEEKYVSKELRRLLRGSEWDYLVSLAGRVVTAVSDRLEVASVTAHQNSSEEASGGEDEGFDEGLTRVVNRQVWHANDLEIEIPDFLKNTVKYGDAYLFEWENDEGGVDVRYRSPLNVMVFYDDEDPRIKKFAINRWVRGTGTKARMRCDLYYQGYILQLVTTKRTKAVKWSDFKPYVTEESDERGLVENPYGIIPIFHGRTERPYGVPEHKRAYGAQDAITKLISGMMSTADFAAFPQRWALSKPRENTDTDIDWGTNETKSPEDLQSNLTAGAGRTWVLDNIDAVGQFAAADMDQFLKPIDKFIELMAAATSTPLSYLHKVRGTSSTPLSGASQRQTDGILIKKIEARQRLLGATLRDAFDFAMEVLGYSDVNCVITWRSSYAMTDKEAWDGVLSQQQAGVPIRQTLLEMEYTEVQVDAWGYTDENPNGEQDDPQFNGDPLKHPEMERQRNLSEGNREPEQQPEENSDE